MHTSAAGGMQPSRDRSTDASGGTADECEPGPREDGELSMYAMFAELSRDASRARPLLGRALERPPVLARAHPRRGGAQPTGGRAHPRRDSTRTPAGSASSATWSWRLRARLGYYSAGSTKLGRSGDFVTAPEISPLFSRLSRESMRRGAARRFRGTSWSWGLAQRDGGGSSEGARRSELAAPNATSSSKSAQTCVSDRQP
jgi:hypothetical protein